MSLEKGNFKKFKDDVEGNVPGDKKKTNKSKYCRRKAKCGTHNDRKFDLNHLFYVNQKIQVHSHHSLLPNLTLEDYPVEDFSDFSRHIYPHYTMNEPCPIYIAKKHCDRVDPCFKRTINRSSYGVRISQARACYLNSVKSSQKARKLERQNVFSPLVYTFAERLERNPDPYFYGNYDFYYTGGNLCVFSNEYQYVMHVDGMDPSVIRASILPAEQNSLYYSLEELATQPLSKESEIFEISPLVDINGQLTNTFGARQRGNITILKVQPQTKNIRLITEFRTKNAPFISFAQSTDKPEMFVLTTMKENVRTYDISRADVSLTDGFLMQKDKSQISWNSVKFWKNQSFLYANERQLYVIDLRIPKEDWLSTSCSFSEKEFECDLISSLATSQFENLFYLGTSHKLRCLDTRFLGKKSIFKNISVCEWTHQLDYPPLLLNVYHSRKREYIACSSPIAGDLRLCELTRSLNADCLTESVYKSYCLPWQPPTLQEAYGSACLSGKALQPEADFKQRIDCCTTGLAFCDIETAKKRSTLMLLANSNGDVYAQRMQKRKPNSSEARTSQRSNEIMAQYANKVSEVAQPDLNYTDVVDFKGEIYYSAPNQALYIDHVVTAMRKVLLSRTLTGDLSKIEEEPIDPEEKKNLKKRFRGSWQKSMSTLHSYKDALVQDLLSVWDIPKEDEVDIKFSALKKKFKKEKSTDDIMKWLNNDQIPAPATSIPLTNLRLSSMDNDENEFLTPADISQTALNETDITQASANRYEMNCSTFESSILTKKPKIAKPKKKHVKGF